MVIGADGRVGRYIAHELEANGIGAVVDRSAEVFEEFEGKSTGMRLTGEVFDSTLLSRPGIERADAFVAATSGDIEHRRRRASPASASACPWWWLDLIKARVDLRALRHSDCLRGAVVGLAAAGNGARPESEKRFRVRPGRGAAGRDRGDRKQWTGSASISELPSRFSPSSRLNATARSATH